MSYGKNNKILSEKTFKQDEEDEDSRYRVFEMKKGDQIVGVWGHQATEGFTSDIIHAFGFYISRKVDPKDPEATSQPSDEDL